MNTRLSEHFTLDELTASETAARQGIDNGPPPGALAALRDTATRLEDVRTLLGAKVITVSSGYRCAELNRAVGSSPGSAHVTGHAVDFNCYAFGPPLRVCEALAGSGIAFDQVIHEFGRWVHISFDPRFRRQLLTIDGHGTRAGLLAIR